MALLELGGARIARIRRKVTDSEKDKPSERQYGRDADANHGFQD